MTPKTKSLWPRLILLGDSLTQMSFSSEGGWGAMLADSLQRRCDVIPRGFSGYNTRQWQSLCKELPVESLCADVALLWLGANDACRSPQQNVPLPEYKNNLAFIVRFLNWTCGVSEVVLLTPPPSNPAGMSDDNAQQRSGELTALYAGACKEAAQDLGVKCIDLHTLFKEQSEWQSLLSDGLHLSCRGAEVVHNAVLPVVAPLVRECGPQNMAEDEQILPLWKDAANVDPCPDIKKWILEHPLPDEAENQA